MKYLGNPFFYCIAFFAMFLWHLNYKIAHKEAMSAMRALRDGPNDM